MKLYLSLNANPAAITSTPFLSFPSKSNNQFFLLKSPTSVSFSTKPSPSFIPLCSSNRFAIPNLKISSLEANGLPQTSKFSLGEESNQNYNVGVGKPVLPIFISTQKLSLSDQAFYLMAFIACTVWFLRLLRLLGALDSSFWSFLLYGFSLLYVSAVFCMDFLLIMAMGFV